MAYSESLARRVRDLLATERGVAEKKMFGGVGFLLNGHMLVGVWKMSLIARLGPEDGKAALQEPHVSVFDITGKPMTGWVLVEPDGLDEDQPLRRWLDRALRFLRTLPAKEVKPAAPSRCGRARPSGGSRAPRSGT